MIPVYRNCNNEKYYKIVCKNQNEAIATATEDAREESIQNNCESISRVALWSGDTLVIACFPDGKISKHITAGWIKYGNVYMSKKTSLVYG